MDDTTLTSHASPESIRQKADSWFSTEGSDAIAQAFKQAKEASVTFREAALVAPEDLNKPMTV